MPSLPSPQLPPFLPGMAQQIGPRPDEPTKDEQLRVAAMNFALNAKKEEPFRSVHDFLTWAEEIRDYIVRGEFKGKGRIGAADAGTNEGKEV